MKVIEKRFEEAVVMLTRKELVLIEQSLILGGNAVPEIKKLMNEIQALVDDHVLTQPAKRN